MSPEEILKGLRSARQHLPKAWRWRKGTIIRNPEIGHAYDVLDHLMRQMLPPLNQKEYELVRANRMIAAIKSYKQRVGTDLTCSKLKVDEAREPLWCSTANTRVGKED